MTPFLNKYLQNCSSLYIFIYICAQQDEQKVLILTHDFILIPEYLLSYKLLHPKA